MNKNEKGGGKPVITGMNFKNNAIMISMILISLTIIFSCIEDVSAAPGDEIYVNTSSGNDSWDGQTPTWNGTSGPKLSIKNATWTVNTNGTIYIANGIYSGGNNSDITINKSLTIRGESSNNTIINITTNNKIFRIFGNVNVTIENLTFTQVNKTYSCTIINQRGNLTVTSIIFKDNFSDYGGGAICNYEGTLTVTSSTFTDNYADYGGGAIENRGNCTVSSSTFTGNNATYGGAILNSGNLTTDNCIFTNNTGAIENRANCTVTNCNFTGNSAGYGGAIANGDNLIVENCNFIGNSAGYGGAIENNGNCTVTNTNFISNSATYGGAISTDGNLTVHFSRFTGNTADMGKAICYNSGSANVENNWWGTNTPYMNSLISPINGSVDYSPWFILKINVNTTTLITYGTSHVAADLTLNSDNQQPVGGVLPNTTSYNAVFSINPANRGTFNPTIVPIINGQADTTFTASYISGSAIGFQATVDSYTVFQQITINLPSRDDIYVAATGNDTTGDGSQLHPYQTISKGINEVNANGRVHIANGIYTGTLNRNITISKNISIIGENQLNTIIDAENSGRIFTVNSGINAIIQNLTLANGNSSWGAAVSNYGTLTVIGSTFTSNTANGGSAIYNYEYLTVTNSTFTNNTVNEAIYNAGASNITGSTFTNNARAIYNAKTLNITGSTFTNNTATYGSAIYNHEYLAVTNSTFTNNTCAIYNAKTLNIMESTFTDNAEAIYNANTLNITGSTFKNNTGTYGGAIYNYEYLTVTNSTFTNNTGAIYNAGTLNITGSIFANNTINDIGSAIFNAIDGILTVNNSTFTNNTATNGGAIFNSGNLTINGGIFTGNTLNCTDNTLMTGGSAIANDGNLTINDSTFTGNIVNNRGGTIFNAVNRTLTVNNCTFTDNTADVGGAIFNYGILTVTGSTFANNNATIGGAITNSGNSTITSSNFLNNNANGKDITQEGRGGAIANDRNLTVNECTFTSNTANLGGTIINMYTGTLTIINANFMNNTATVGGAIINSGNSTITSSDFSNNTANSANSMEEGFGGAIANDGDLTIDDSTFTDNTASDRGGAIFNAVNSILNVNNSTFIDNTADLGGAVWNIGDLTVDNGNFTGNTANYGGAIINSANSIITRSNFLNNTANGTGNSLGGAIANDSNLTVTGSNFENNHSFNGGAIWTSGILTAHFNRFIGNSDSYGYTISNSGSGNATLNWWGDNNGPAGKVYGMTADLWLILTVTALPNNITSGNTSIVTADLLHDNQGSYHAPASGHVPGGIPLNFATTLGTISPVSANITNGIAQGILTATGTTNVSAAVDNQTVNTTVTVKIAPTVSSVDPVNGSITTNVNKVITITFSESIEAGSAYNNIKVITPSKQAKTITKTINGNVLTITATYNYTPGNYTIYIPVNAVKNAAGDGLAGNYTSTFIIDQAPAVNSVNPTNGSTVTNVNQVITVTFSEDIEAGSAYNNIKVITPTGQAKTITKTINGNVLTITATYNYTPGTYTIYIPVNAVQDLAGNGLAVNYTSKFTVNTATPTVVSVDPANGSIVNKVNQVITITFSEPIEAGRAYNNIKVITPAGQAKTITKNISGNVLTITATYNYKPGTYTIYIPVNAVKNAAGNSLIANYTSTFTISTG